MRDCVIEARINEYAMRSQSPHIPWTQDEIIRDAVRVQEAGATVLHVHARTDSGGADNSVETNAKLISRLREHTDLYIHLTLGFHTNDDSPETRAENIRRLCEDLDCPPDIVPIDVGSCNLERYDRENQKVSGCDVYLNSTDSTLLYAKEFSSLCVNVQFFCWGVTFVRRGAMLMELGLIRRQPHFIFHLTGGQNISCNPPTPLGLDSMLEVLPDGAPWGIAVGGTSMFGLLPYALSKGANVSIGLGDYSYPEFPNADNAALIQRVKEAIAQSGRKPASKGKTRELLGLAR